MTVAQLDKIIELLEQVLWKLNNPPQEFQFRFPQGNQVCQYGCSHTIGEVGDCSCQCHKVIC